MFSIYISWSWLVQINNYAFALLTAGFFTFDKFCNLSINLSCNSMPYSAYLWGGLIKNKGGVGLTVCSCHDTYAFQSESTLYSCLNVKKLLSWSRCEIWKLSECNWTQTQNHLVLIWTLNHVRTKWFWVRGSASRKEFLEIQTTIACGFIMKCVRDMTRTYSQMRCADKYSEHSSIIWQAWPNGWVFV